MATAFEFVMVHGDERRARQVAEEAFAEIDRIEQALSSYISSSDISQLNHATAGAPVPVSLRTFECLDVAMRAFRETGGAFDVTVGPLLRLWRVAAKAGTTQDPVDVAAAKATVNSDKLVFDRNKVQVACQAEGMQLDMGGIGKGYALDKAAQILREWDIATALLQCGDSTALGIGVPGNAPGWAVGVGGDGASTPPHRIYLRDRALSGSGTAIQGRHILDPRTGAAVTNRKAAWSSCPSAAMADALSTAFMVMTPEEIQRYCATHPDTCAAILPEGAPATETQWIGAWNDLVPSHYT